MMKRSKQAFIEFRDLQSATQFVNAYQKEPPTIRGSPIYVQYSMHQELKGGDPPSSDIGRPGRVLLVTIHNQLYPITVDVLSQIFSPYETNPLKTVERIVIFQRPAGLQALVQFSSVDVATRALELNGKNIYSNCCTLQLQYSNMEEVTVRENSDRSKDFTNPNLPDRANEPILKQPREAPVRHANYSNSSQFVYHSSPNRAISSRELNAAGGSRSLFRPQTASSSSRYQPNYQNQSQNVGMGGISSVLLISRIPHNRMKCQQLFNLFSNYGAIVRIKVLRGKPDKALVQYEDIRQAENALYYLRGVRVFGSDLDVTYSKFQEIRPSSNALVGGSSHTGQQQQQGERNEEDGEAAEYLGTTQNRAIFTNQNPHEVTVLGPTTILHISGVSPETTQEQITQHFSQVGTVNGVRIFDTAGRHMALVQYANLAAAVDAMALLHQTQLNGRILRLSFTRNHI